MLLRDANDTDLFTTVLTVGIHDDHIPIVAPLLPGVLVLTQSLEMFPFHVLAFVVPLYVPQCLL